MISKVIFVPQVAAEAMQGSAHQLLVSITEPGRPAALQSGWKAVLRLQFDDIDTPQPGCQMFEEHDAHSLLAFVEAHAQTSTELVVHCHAGISRSAAVAKFFAEKYACDYPAHYSLYNKAIYRELCRVARGAAGRESAFGEVLPD